MSKKEVDVFDASNEVKSNWIHWGVIQEDKVFGTLIAKRKVKSTIPGKEGEDVMVYELKTDYGSFHNADENKQIIPEPVKVNANEYWSIGGKPSIDRQMQNITIGTKVGFKFIETQPSKTKGFAPAKIIKVFVPRNDDGTPTVDKEWLEAQQSVDGF